MFDDGARFPVRELFFALSADLPTADASASFDRTVLVEGEMAAVPGLGARPLAARALAARALLAVTVFALAFGDGGAADTLPKALDFLAEATGATSFRTAAAFLVNGALPRPIAVELA